MTYATTADIKAYLGISGTGDDVLLADLLQSAGAAIDTYTNRAFAVTGDTTRYLDAVGDHIRGYTLYLDRDLCQITSVVNGDGTTVTTSQYTTIPRNETPYRALRLLGSAGLVWTYSDDWEGAIAVTGRWGYSIQPPYDIQQATVRLASFYYRQKDAQLADVTAIEAGVVIQTPAMPADVLGLIRPYRKL